VIPGSNLLNMAFQLIAQQSLSYYRFAGRNLNAVGQDVSYYDGVQIIKTSFQPVPKSQYSYLGLDLQKSYYNMYVSKDIIDIRRDVSSDQVVFEGKLYQCISNTEWAGIDGWVAVLCVYIGPHTGVNDKPIFGFDIKPPVSMNQNYFGSNFSPGEDG
jgi:hypothetical protein